jgi:hypothetical protein
MVHRLYGGRGDGAGWVRMGIDSEGALTAHYHAAAATRKEQARMGDEGLLSVQREGRRNPHRAGKYGVNPELFHQCAAALHDKDRAHPTPAGIRGLDNVVEGDWVLPWSVQTAVFRTSLLKVSLLFPPLARDSFNRYLQASTCLFCNQISPTGIGANTSGRLISWLCPPAKVILPRRVTSIRQRLNRR